MRRHNRYVNLYAGGARGPVVTRQRYMERYIQEQRAKDPEYTACSRCGRYYKDPSKNHFTDPKNKIRCL